MSKKLKRIEFAEEFRSFKKGQVFELEDGLTLITGNNGAGKSSFVGCIRGLYTQTPWTLSDFNTTGMLTNESIDDGCLYIDLNMDLLKNRLDMDYDNISLHRSVIHKSAGECALVQLVTLMSESKCKMIVIDEPERGLSEANQFFAAKFIEGFVTKNPDVQVIVTTHSTVFMSVLNALSPIYLMPQFAPLTLEKYQEYNRLLGESNWAGYVNEVANNG